MPRLHTTNIDGKDTLSIPPEIEGKVFLARRICGDAGGAILQFDNGGRYPVSALSLRYRSESSRRDGARVAVHFADSKINLY